MTSLMMNSRVVETLSCSPRARNQGDGSHTKKRGSKTYRNTKPTTLSRIGANSTPERRKSEPAKKGPKPGNDKLCRSSRQKNPVKRYGHNKYMAYHYVYITMVAEVGEPERYAKAEKDTNWCAVVKKCVHLMPTKHGTSLTLLDTVNPRFG